jgi:hypothetical protein
MKDIEINNFKPYELVLEKPSNNWELNWTN